MGNDARDQARFAQVTTAVALESRPSVIIRSMFSNLESRRLLVAQLPDLVFDCVHFWMHSSGNSLLIIARQASRVDWRFQAQSDTEALAVCIHLLVDQDCQNGEVWTWTGNQLVACIRLNLHRAQVAQCLFAAQQNCCEEVCRQDGQNLLLNRGQCAGQKPTTECNAVYFYAWKTEPNYWATKAGDYILRLNVLQQWCEQSQINFAARW